ncbi:MAG: response regulator [Dehalococcoidia bacterium]|nr:response regulator [Dehalococcoidia bacterium]
MQKILLIQHDLALKEQLTFLLQHSGFRVVNAMGSQQALSEIHRSPPDLIVLAEGIQDYEWDLSGDEFCICIREISQAPIIILGKGCGEAAGIDLLESGADAYLTSPLNPTELLAWVRSLLRRARIAETEPEGG